MQHIYFCVPDNGQFRHTADGFPSSHRGDSDASLQWNGIQPAATAAISPVGFLIAVTESTYTASMTVYLGVVDQWNVFISNNMTSERFPDTKLSHLQG